MVVYGSAEHEAVATWVDQLAVRAKQAITASVHDLNVDLVPFDLALSPEYVKHVGDVNISESIVHEVCDHAGLADCSCTDDDNFDAPRAVIRGCWLWWRRQS